MIWPFSSLESAFTPEKVPTQPAKAKLPELSPLVALIADQVSGLARRGIVAGALVSGGGTDARALAADLARAPEPRCKVLFVTPEGLAGDRVRARPWTPAYAWRTEQGFFERLPLPRSPSEQASLTTLAATAEPVLTPAVSDEAEVLARVHQLAGRTVDGWSRGPRAQDAWLPPEQLSVSSRR